MKEFDKLIDYLHKEAKDPRIDRESKIGRSSLLERVLSSSKFSFDDESMKLIAEIKCDEIKYLKMPYPEILFCFKGAKATVFSKLEKIKEDRIDLINGFIKRFVLSNKQFSNFPNVYAMVAWQISDNKIASLLFDGVPAFFCYEDGENLYDAKSFINGGGSGDSEKEKQYSNFIGGLYKMSISATESINNNIFSFIKKETENKSIRKSLGKKTYDSYHIVDLTKPAYEQKEHQGGTHASPRMHERRGFYKTSKLGKRFWVRNTIVNKDQEHKIIKEYKV